MTRDDDYRNFAKEAQRQADANEGEAKASWLQIAQGWLGLISKPKPAPTPEQTPEQTFEAHSTAKRTEGNGSRSSH